MRVRLTASVWGGDEGWDSRVFGECVGRHVLLDVQGAVQALVVRRKKKHLYPGTENDGAHPGSHAGGNLT